MGSVITGVVNHPTSTGRCFSAALRTTCDTSIITLPLIQSQPIRDKTVQRVQYDVGVTVTQTNDSAVVVSELLSLTHKKMWVLPLTKTSNESGEFFFFFLLYLSFCCFSISHIECLRLNSLTKLRYDRSNSIWSGEQTSGNDNSSVCDEKSLNYAWQLLLFAIRFSVFLSYLCFQSKPFPYFHIIRRLLPFYHQTLPQLHVLAWRIRQYFKYKTI